jgi:NADH:ubiquinone oxidoreductase subunit 3 (subunit A)
LLLGLSASFFPTTLLFLLLDLALADLFLKSLESSSLGILLLLEFQLTLVGLVPVTVLAISTVPVALG